MLIVIQATGNGTGTTASKIGNNQGLSFHHNTVFGLGYGLYANGGWFDIVDVSDNLFDEVPHPLYIGAGGAIDGRWDGGVINNGTTVDGQPDTSTANTVFYWKSDSAPSGGTLAIDHVRIQFASGSFLDMENTSDSVVGVVVTNPDWESGGLAGGVDGIVWNGNASSRPILAGGIVAMGRGSSATNACFNLESNVQTLMISGVTFLYCGYVITASGGAPSHAVVGNNVSAGTRTGIFGGLYPSYLNGVGNAWDLVTPGVEIARRPSDNALSFVSGGAAVASVSTTGVTTASDLAINSQASALVPWTIAPAPTVTPTSGTFATVSATLRYSKPFNAKQVFYSLQVNETALGTASGSLIVSNLPFTQQGSSDCNLSGREIATTGKQVTMVISPGSTQGQLTYADNSVPISNGAQIVLSGTCETAN